MKANLFVSALPTYDHRQTIADKIHQCEAKRSAQYRIHWTHTQDLHVTLGYLADIEISDVQGIAKCFSILKETTRFIAKTKDLRLYGNALIMRLEPEQVFAGIHKKLKQQLSLNYPEKYQFKAQARFEPHITLGHLQMPTSISTTQKYQLTTQVSEYFMNLSFLMQQGALMQRMPESPSRIKRSEPVYQVLQSYAFK